MSSVTSSHYEAHSAESYEQAYFYEPGAYQQYLVRLVQDRFQLQDTAKGPLHILDIGGGTGNFAQALVEETPQHRVTVVDPFLDPTRSTSSQLSFVKAGAEAFLSSRTDAEDWRQDFQGILLKEVVHHLKDRVKIFQGMHQELPTAGSLLIITRPQVDIDYPLWSEARVVWKKNQPSSQELRKDLEQAGFSSIDESLESYPCSISFARWQEMVQNRFWSTFSNFSDPELQDACQRMATEHKERIDEKGVIHFEDRLVFLLAKKT